MGLLGALRKGSLGGLGDFDVTGIDLLRTFLWDDETNALLTEVLECNYQRSHHQ